MTVADLHRLTSAPGRRPYRRGRARGRRIRLALIARWRAAELDRQFAAGASPDASALLEIRGRRLTSRGHRANVAAGLARAVHDAGCMPHGFSAAVRPDAREVVAARIVLVTVYRRLHAPEPVSARGIALLESLLTDGTSPLYRPTQPGALGSRLRAAAAALEPPVWSSRVRVRQEALG